MSENKFDRFFSGKGYYIALTLCAAAIGIMSYVYYSGQEEPAVQTANAPVSVVGTVALPTRTVNYMTHFIRNLRHKLQCLRIILLPEIHNCLIYNFQQLHIGLE